MKNYGKSRRQSIRHHVVFLTLAFTLIIVGVVLSGIVAFTSKQIKNNNLRSAEYRLKTASSVICQRINEIDNLVNWCGVNDIVRTYLLSDVKNTTLRNEIYNRVNSKCGSAGIMPYIQRMLMISANGNRLMVGSYVSSTRMFTIDEVKELPGFGGDENGTRWEFIAEDKLVQPGVSMSGIPVTRIISGKNTAYIHISVSTSLITDVLEDFTLEESSSLYWYMGGAVYEADGSSLIPSETGFSPLNMLSDSSVGLSEDSLLFENKEENYSVVACPIGVHGLYLAQSVPESVCGVQTLLIQPILFISAAIILLGVLLSTLVQRVIGRPIKALLRRIEQIGQGNFTADPTIEWNHELGDVGRSINNLSSNITALMEQKLEDEKKKQELEYRVLQSQINPHFLYNTLNSIRWMAAIQRADSIVEMVMALSRLLKSVSKSTERLVPLREELKLLDDYLTIQRYRYGGTITFETHCLVEDKELDSYLIPRFALQPLAENAIFHGIEPKGCAGQLILTLKYGENNNALVIELYDNGTGMTKEQIKAAFSAAEEKDSEKFSQIGIMNVNKRLKYSFGEEYGLKLESVIGEYTVVSFTLPPQNERDNTDNTDNTEKSDDKGFVGR